MNIAGAGWRVTHLKRWYGRNDNSLKIPYNDNKHNNDSDTDDKSNIKRQ